MNKYKVEGKQLANKKSYSRYFIILQEDEKGHSISPEKQSSGYAKIEMKNDKCKVSFYVQNIKREKVSCYMFLIANKKDCKKIINLGLLNIDDNGRADITYECTADNIGDSNISMDKVGGAAIGKFIGGKPVFVMSGFASTEIPDKWKEYSILDCKKKEVKVEIKEEIKEKIKEEIKTESKDEDTEKKTEEKKSEEKKETKEKKAEDNKEKKEKKCDSEDEKRAEATVEEKKEEKETASKEEKEILEADAGEKKAVEEVGEEIVKEEIVKEETIDVIAKIYSPPVQRDKSEENNKFDEYERSIEKSKPEYERKNKENNEKANKDTKKNEESKEAKDDNKEMPKDTAGEFFKSIMNGFEEMKDVCSEIKNCRWYKVPVKDLEAMCNISNYNKYTVVYYPMINYYPYIKKYGYYMMGLKCDNEGNLKYLAYGLPGTKNKEEQPYSGRTGFVTWAPITSDEDHESHIGYWIMFYDFKNSIIVVPMK